MDVKQEIETVSTNTSTSMKISPMLIHVSIEVLLFAGILGFSIKKNRDLHDRIDNLEKINNQQSQQINEMINEMNNTRTILTTHAKLLMKQKTSVKKTILRVDESEESEPEVVVRKKPVEKVIEKPVERVFEKPIEKSSFNLSDVEEEDLDAELQDELHELNELNEE